MTATDSIVLGATPTKSNAGLLGPLLPPNTRDAGAHPHRPDERARRALRQPRQAQLPPACRRAGDRQGAAHAPATSATDVDGQPRTPARPATSAPTSSSTPAPTAAIAVKTPTPRATIPVDVRRLGLDRSRERPRRRRSPSTAGPSATAARETTAAPTVDHIYARRGDGRRPARRRRPPGRRERARDDAGRAAERRRAPAVVITKPKPKATIALLAKQRKGQKTARAARRSPSPAPRRPPAGVKSVILTIQKVGTHEEDLHVAGQEEGPRQGAVRQAGARSTPS